jgi:hypothetical protein
MERIKVEENFTFETDPNLEEDIGNPDSITERDRLSRRERWYEGLKTNVKLIAKELPMLITGFRHRSVGEMPTIQFRAPSPIKKRAVRIREKVSHFQTNSDAYLHIFALGLDIAEYIYMQHPDGLEENEAYQQLAFDSRYMEIYSLVNHRSFLLREVAKTHAAGNITDQQFFEEIKIIFDSSTPEVKERIKELYLKLFDEKGFSKESEKEKSRIRSKRYRENKGGLRLVK